jgi:hypothetical protein
MEDIGYYSYKYVAVTLSLMSATPSTKGLLRTDCEV